MENGCSLVVDVGKTNAKMTLWSRGGDCLARRERANGASPRGQYPSLDLSGLEAWVKSTARDFAKIGVVQFIAPVAHGAAAALVRQGRLFAAPMDYEAEIPAPVRARHDTDRDPFVDTGSPRLPLGLNLGVQLEWLEEIAGPWPDDLQVLLWPQYWAWRFCGMPASEVSSLGCHSDLWRPAEGRFSDLAVRRGWADRFPPLRHAGAILGPVTPEWVIEVGLPADCQVICGLHDSNAALVAAKGHPEMTAGDGTIVSTGTWFVAMRLPGAQELGAVALSESRDCLINVDVDGHPTPSSRFMGGREFELLGDLGGDPDHNSAAVVAAIPQVAGRLAMAIPTFSPGVGPFPHLRGHWEREPTDPDERRAALSLYLALMTDICLDLIGARGPILVEGRFAAAEGFTRSLATLRDRDPVFVSDDQDDVPLGALRLIRPELRPKSPLTQARPLDQPLDRYRAAWRSRASETAP